jgi:hypothetical protein
MILQVAFFTSEWGIIVIESPEAEHISVEPDPGRDKNIGIQS